jgi:hypothetical protein
VDVYKRVFPGLLILAALVLGSAALAIEPDGRVAFRFSWPDGKDGNAPRLRLSMTAVTNLADAHLVAKIPSGVGLSIRGGAAGGAWPDEGLAIGSLAAGRSFVVEFDVLKPPRGGGIVSFVLQATCEGRAVSEGVGVPFGMPGTEPTLRNGAAEFPASSPDPTP